MKEKKIKNVEVYNDKLDFRISCCLVGGYLILYRVIKVFL